LANKDKSDIEFIFEKKTKARNAKGITQKGDFGFATQKNN